MNRTFKILGVVLILQIIIYVLVSSEPQLVKVKKAFLSVDTSQVNYIKIKNEKGELVMHRVGATWRVSEPYDYPANPSYAKTLLEKVAALKLETYISDNAEKHSLYQLDDLTAKYVEIGVEDGKIDKFYCGKASDSYTHTYLRRADSDEVWLVTGSPRSSFSRAPKQWRNKKILALDKTMIEKIILRFPKNSIELERIIASVEDSQTGEVDTTWMAHTSRGADFVPIEKATNRILNTLKRLNAIDFIDAGSEDMPSFDNPEFTIEVFLEGDQHEVIEFIPQADEDTRWVARKNGDDSTVFVVYQSSVKNLKKDEADLKGEDKDKEA